MRASRFRNHIRERIETRRATSQCLLMGSMSSRGEGDLFNGTVTIGNNRLVRSVSIYYSDHDPPALQGVRRICG